MSPAKGKSGKKSTSRKPASNGNTKNGSKRVQEQKINSLRRMVNAVLISLGVFLVLFAAYEIWIFLDKPGFPNKPPKDKSICIELYFYDSTMARLVPVRRKVTMAQNENKTSRAVKEFALGPKDTRLGRVYPSNIPLPQVRIDKKTAIIDLPEEFKWGVGYTSESTKIDAFTLTVRAAGECDSVRFLKKGIPAEVTEGGIMIDSPSKPPEKLNQLGDSSIEENSVWVRTYYLDETGTYLMPLTIQSKSDSEAAEMAVKYILEGPPKQAHGIRPVVSPGYVLERLAIENNVATIELDVPNIQTAFLNSDVNLFRRAAYLSLRDCCGVEDVRLNLDGIEISSISRFASLPDIKSDDCYNLEVESRVAITGDGG